VLAVGVVAFIYTALIYLPNSRSGYSDSRVADQLKYCLDHPLAFPSAVLNVVEHSTIGLLGSAIGGFGHNDAYISGFWVVVLLAVAVLAVAYRCGVGEDLFHPGIGIEGLAFNDSDGRELTG